MKSILLAGVLILVIGTPAALFYLSSETVIGIDPAPRVLAPSSALPITAKNPHGVRTLRVTLRQGAASSVTAVEQPADRWFFWKKHLPATTTSLRIDAGPGRGFKSGSARLTVEAVSNDFRAVAAVREFDVIVNLDPPKVSADTAQHYLNLGGAELVTFTVSGYWTEAGVKVGGHKFRSFALPGAKSQSERFCLFALPWDTPAGAEPLVFAANPAGQEVTAPFHYKIKPKQFRRRSLELTDAFLEKAVNEIDPGGAGEMLERFLRINREVRRRNNAMIASLRDQTEPRMLWSPPFQQLSNSKVEAFFADVRSYTYQGRKVDEQVHLGFDLSKVKEAPVMASNSGKVVFADRLGIYGNCIVVDHGYGLQSIYAHLSRIGVKKGQVVQRGEEIGRSGATGLAGGDHLHFSMQIDGVQVNPVEWWDAHWLRDRIFSRLPG